MGRRLPRRPTVVAICLVAICLAVAALHLVAGPTYAGPFRAFVRGDLIDVALPFSLVLLLGIGFANVPRLAPPGVRAGLVVAFGGVVEGCRYFGIPLFGRTADVLDLVAYAAGALLAMGFERALLGRTERPGSFPDASRRADAMPTRGPRPYIAGERLHSHAPMP